MVYQHLNFLESQGSLKRSGRVQENYLKNADSQWKLVFLLEKSVIFFLFCCLQALEDLSNKEEIDENRSWEFLEPW